MMPCNGRRPDRSPLRDAALLAQALTIAAPARRTTSAWNSSATASSTMIIAEALYRRWPKADEGAMTRARAELVRARRAGRDRAHPGLGAALTLGPGEMKSGGHRRDSILADAVEAVVAAIYLDRASRPAAPCCPGSRRCWPIAGGKPEGRQDPPAGMAAGAQTRCRLRTGVRIR
jgi:hypothetical protein